MGRSFAMAYEIRKTGVRDRLVEVNFFHFKVCSVEMRGFARRLGL